MRGEFIDQSISEVVLATLRKVTLLVLLLISISELGGEAYVAHAVERVVREGPADRLSRKITYLIVGPLGKQPLDDAILSIGDEWWLFCSVPADPARIPPSSNVYVSNIKLLI